MFAVELTGSQPKQTVFRGFPNTLIPMVNEGRQARIEVLMLGAVLTCAYRYSGREEFDFWFDKQQSADNGQLGRAALRAELSGSPTFLELTKQLSELCCSIISQPEPADSNGGTNIPDCPAPEFPDDFVFCVHDLLCNPQRASGFDRISSPAAVKVTCVVETTTIGLEFLKEQHSPELIPQFLESLQVLMQGPETTPEVPIT
jgi:hypothetical protein